MQDTASAYVHEGNRERVRATTIVQVQAIQVVDLQLPPFRTHCCIGRASRYCYPAANLGNLNTHRFLGISLALFQPQRTNCRNPAAVETMDNSAKHIQ
jgi:hypothetical protein